MEITAVNMILAVIVLLVCPVLTGKALCSFLKLEMSLSRCFLSGMIVIWAFCQLIAVPLVLTKQSFSIVVILMSVFIIGSGIMGLVRGSFKPLLFRIEKRKEITSVVCASLAVLTLLVLSVISQHVDDDDARFVVNAVDILKTNRMYLTNPATGESVQNWIGEISKDVTSPWAVYIAFLSRITGLHATVMAHTFMPIMLLLMACAVFWLLSEDFFGDDIVSRGIFLCIILFLYLYGDYSRRSAERFMMVRIWQGKAVVASVGIPAVFLIAMWIYKDVKKTGNYILLCLLGVAMSLMSGMGIIISTIMMGCIGLIYGIVMKKWKVMLGIWGTALPALLFCILNFAQG